MSIPVVTTKIQRYILSVILAGAALPLLADTTVIIDPGAPGSSFGYQNFDFFDLRGMSFNGQTLSLDLRLPDSEFLVAASLSIELYLQQNGALGTWPSTSFAVSGQLLDHGQPVNALTVYPQNLWMPAQIWPGWPYQLPDGTPYVPVTTGYGSGFSGPQSAFDHGRGGYDITPFTFDEIRLDLTFPDSPADSLLGSRFQLAGLPIYVSPDHAPEYFIRVPDGAHSVLLLGTALAMLGLVGAQAPKNE
jgi:hypothetical protein